MIAYQTPSSSQIKQLVNFSFQIDSAFPKEACEIADQTLGDGKYKPGYHRAYWPGCTHGFAVSLLSEFERSNGS